MPVAITPKSLIVAPFTGAWIETMYLPMPTRSVAVAPFTGAWIETCRLRSAHRALRRSLPSRERGLKLGVGVPGIAAQVVAPFTGAWIET